nr:hypothetical protein [Terrimicrobiaceae bacterium]
VTAGIAEMLLQSHRRTPDGRTLVDLLPALPDAWPAGSVRGLRARGGLSAAMAWSGGRITEAEIFGAPGTAFRLRTPDGESDIVLGPDGLHRHRPPQS